LAAIGRSLSRTGTQISDAALEFQARDSERKGSEAYSAALVEMGQLLDGDLLTRTGSQAEGVVDEWIAASNKHKDSVNLSGQSLAAFNKYFGPFQASMVRQLAAHESTELRNGAILASATILEQEYASVLRFYNSPFELARAIATAQEQIALSQENTKVSDEQIKATQLEFAQKSYTSAIKLMIAEDPTDPNITTVFKLAREGKWLTQDAMLDIVAHMELHTDRVSRDMLVDGLFTQVVKGDITAAQAREIIKTEFPAGDPRRADATGSFNAQISVAASESTRNTQLSAIDIFQKIDELMDGPAQDNRAGNPAVQAAWTMAQTLVHLPGGEKLKKAAEQTILNKAGGYTAYVSNQEVIADLMKLAGRDPHTYATDTNLMDFRGDISRDDMMPLLKLQDSIRRGDIDADTGKAEAAIERALNAIGMDEVKRKKAGNAVIINNLHRSMHREIEQNRVAKGSPLLTSELDDIVASQTRKIYEAWWWTDDDIFAFQVPGFTEEEANQARAALVDRGVEITNDAILKYFADRDEGESVSGFDFPDVEFNVDSAIPSSSSGNDWVAFHQMVRDVARRSGKRTPSDLRIRQLWSKATEAGLR
jgi:hypothetical protein